MKPELVSEERLKNLAGEIAASLANESSRSDWETAQYWAALTGARAALAELNIRRVADDVRCPLTYEQGTELGIMTYCRYLHRECRQGQPVCPLQEGAVLVRAKEKP